MYRRSSPVRGVPSNRRSGSTLGRYRLNVYRRITHQSGAPRHTSTVPRGRVYRRIPPVGGTSTVGTPRRGEVDGLDGTDGTVAVHRSGGVPSEPSNRRVSVLSSPVEGAHRLKCTDEYTSRYASTGELRRYTSRYTIDGWKWIHSRPPLFDGYATSTVQSVHLDGKTAHFSTVHQSRRRVSTSPVESTV